MAGDTFHVVAVHVDGHWIRAVVREREAAVCPRAKSVSHPLCKLTELGLPEHNFIGMEFANQTARQRARDSPSRCYLPSTSVTLRSGYLCCEKEELDVRPKNDHSNDYRGNRRHQHGARCDIFGVSNQGMQLLEGRVGEQLQGSI